MDISRELVRIARDIDRTAGGPGSGYHYQEGGMWFTPDWSIKLVRGRAATELKKASKGVGRFAEQAEDVYADELLPISKTLGKWAEELDRMTRGYDTPDKATEKDLEILGKLDGEIEKLDAIGDLMGRDVHLESLDDAKLWLERIEQYYK